ALQGGERYQTFGLADSMGTVTGGRPGIEQPGEFQRVELQPETEALASGAPWLLTPRRARAQALDQPAYLGAVRSILAQNGLPQAKPRLTQVLRVDLEGDGREEVLLAAESPDFVKPSIEPNSYSLVALRRVVGNGVKTTLLAGEFHARAAEFAAPAGYQVAAVADLDGDDILEIVVRWAYYEGAGAGVFQLRGGQPKEVIASGMGA
ncbi:MAG: hypothetical protein HUU35_16355, partial [Armatimonadetes bacterium]|nr:hypothetical protein [Armatimonadota bacterium]